MWRRHRFVCPLPLNGKMLGTFIMSFVQHGNGTEKLDG